MKVRLSESAAGAYDNALARIREVNRLAASRFADRVKHALQRLGSYPEIGHFVPEFESAPLRQFIVEPYRFFYFIDQRHKTILVVDIWHGSQLPRAPELPQHIAE
jgi:plasmid stabilization system protein ParE